jgi:trimeric autotransporter adhesin
MAENEAGARRKRVATTMGRTSPVFSKENTMKSLSISCLIFVGCLLSGLYGAHAKITDANWSAVGQSSEFYYDTDYSPPVYAVDKEGNFYVCGGGLIAGGMVINSIAQWDNHKWAEIAPGINGARIGALAFDSSGKLYAGTSVFYSDDSLVINHVEKWDGTVWRNVGGDLHGMISALAFDAKGNLYAGTDGVTRPGVVEKWDGAAWTTLAEIPSGFIKGLAVDRQGTLYACGSFNAIGSVRANSVAKWDGTKWGPLGAGVREVVSLRYPDTTFSRQARLSGLLMSGNDLYVYGSIDSAGSIATHTVAKWDGSSWSAVGSGSDYYIGNLVTDRQGGIYAPEYCLVENLNVRKVVKLAGNEWAVIDSEGYAAPWEYRPNPDLFYPWLVTFDNSDNIYGMCYWNFMRFHGGKWTFFCEEKGVNGYVSAFALDSASGNLYVSGSFSSAGSTPIRDIARWDGRSWSALDSGKGLKSSGIRALAMGKNGILYAVAGGFGGSDTLSTLAAWNGASWRTIATIVCNLGIGCQKSFSALALDAEGSLFVGGYFDTLGGKTVHNIAKWNGTAWSSLGAGTTGEVRALVFDRNGNLFAGGRFDKAGSVTVRNIAQWNGTAWAGLGEGIPEDQWNAPVNVLAFDNSGILYAGGSFSVAGGVEAHNIAQWNGTAWSPLGEGVGIAEADYAGDGGINALAFDNGGLLYAGGNFDVAGSIKANGVARWDGSAWSDLGGGIKRPSFFNDNIYVGNDNGTAYALLCDKNGTLSVGGAFSVAGGKTSCNFAQCKLTGNNTAFSGGQIANQPRIMYESNKGLVHVRCISNTRFQVTIYSLSGRAVFRASEFMTAGDHAFIINTAGLARGTYVAHIRAGNEMLRSRVVIGQ